MNYQTDRSCRKIPESVQKEIKVKPPFPAVLPQLALYFLLVSSPHYKARFAEALPIAILSVHFYLELSKRRHIHRRQSVWQRSEHTTVSGFFSLV